MSMKPDQVASNKSAVPSPWTGGDIPIREGNCKVLLIAPHGHRDNDGRTYSITRMAADAANSYAIVNKTYRKPPYIKSDDGTDYLDENRKKVRHAPNKNKKWVNLNRKNHVHEHLEAEFEAPLRKTVNEIIEKFGNAIVIWIHGMKDINLIPKNTEGNRSGMDALIGIGQGEPQSLTAKKKTVEKLIAALGSNPIKPINAALANKGSNFCGWHENIMNQFFIADKYGLDKVESIQVEIKRIGFRDTDNYKVTADAIADTISEITMQKPKQDTEQAFLDSAVQKGIIQQIKAGEIADFAESDFKFRYDEIESDKEKFDSLVESIRINGVLNNIIVRRRNDGKGKPYQLISGFRRMTALKVALSENGDFENADVPARVLDAKVSDDDAYRISFTENLARKDLSLWEIAQACADIEKKRQGLGKSKADIDNYIANLIQKGPRTVRRYLKLAKIKNNDIKEAVHNGSINYLDALEIGENNLEEGDIAALLGHMKTFPKSTRAFKQFYDNIEYCGDRSGLNMATILGFKNADSFLSLEKEELEARIDHLHQKTDKDYPDILQGKAGSLIKDAGEFDAGLEKKKAASDFRNQNTNLIERVTEAFSKSNINGKFKIKPVQNSAGNQVSITVTAPETEIWQAIDAVSKANLAPVESEKLKKKPKAQTSESAAPPTKEKDKATSIDVAETRSKGEFQL